MITINNKTMVLIVLNTWGEFLLGVDCVRETFSIGLFRIERQYIN